MEFQPVFTKKTRPVVIAGPCSAETEEQMLETAIGIAATGRVDFFRAGIWKPRTRPGAFEGVGMAGLPWLQMVKKETGMPVTIEVANASHVHEALKSGVDMLWIGARSTVNPFTVQEIADALRGVDVPVLIKNPVNADLDLWLGAVERIAQAGIRRVGVIHRGFSFFGKTPYRNLPTWQIPIELMRRFPGMTILGDPSHICGNRHLLGEIAQKCLDLNYDGLMIETHRAPDDAWSDAAQQVTPAGLAKLLDGLVIRKPAPEGIEFADRLDSMRRQIDRLDAEMLDIFGKRMGLADQIGAIKRASQVAILQPRRWNEILERALEKGPELGLSPGFVMALFEAVHQESINHQARVMNATDNYD